MSASDSKECLRVIQECLRLSQTSVCKWLRRVSVSDSDEQFCTSHRIGMVALPTGQVVLV